MGTPQFAVPSLEALHNGGYEIAAVVTAPDKPAGRGQTPKASPVKQCAIKNGMPVLQPANLKAPGFIDALRALNADLFVVVAFRMLPESVWSLPPLGTINLHASLLPDYRGAAPINHAIMRGETETGLTTFFLKHAIDTGDILLRCRIPIAPEDTAGTLHDTMMEAGADLLLETVNRIAAGNYTTTPQPGNSAKAAPKIFKADCEIPWNRPAADIVNFIRGLSPYPGAWTLLDGKMLKVFAAKAVPGKPVQTPGSYSTDGKSYLRFTAGEGAIEIAELQLEGKKKMHITEFLKGYRFDT